MALLKRMPLAVLHTTRWSITSRHQWLSDKFRLIWTRNLYGVAPSAGTDSKSQIRSAQVADLGADVLEIGPAKPALLRQFQVWQRDGVEIPVGLCDIGIHRHRVSARNQRLVQRDVLQVAAGWAIAQQHAIAVKHGQGGQHERGQIDQALMDLLMQPVSAGRPEFHTSS